MANTIQIKRAGSSGNTIPSSLAVGELAYAENGSKLYIGTSGSTITEVGGSGGFAVLASPTFTGTPLSTTASAADNSTQIATTAFVKSVALTADSPTLTGTPLAPTAASSVNTTQIATTAYVTTAVSNLINSAPAALDTLDELAAALGDDANYAATITTALSGKLGTTATIDGGTF
jgi:hypothetical protein